jgi:2,3-bisphosphoglycerate-independent phosphoglycerate mutase
MPVTPRYVIIVPSGAADEPLSELGNRTPLEVAETPHLDSIVAAGRQGTVRTIPSGFQRGSDVALMSLLGYDVTRHYTGRGPLEAVARNATLGRDDVAFRCNFVTIADGDMADHTAGHLRTAEARQLIDALNAAFSGESDVRFSPGQSYRNLLLLRDPRAVDAVCIPPHDIAGERVSDYLPRGACARRLHEIMERAAGVISTHDVNLVRRDLGETPANAIWPWGQGLVPILKRFRQQHGVRGAMVAARGLAKLLGWSCLDVQGATGQMDTDYVAKAAAAAAALDEYDLVTIHVHAPAQAGRLGDAAAKIQALEKIDACIVGPVLARLRTFEQWRILVALDVYAPLARKADVPADLPFTLCGTGVVQGLIQEHFSERLAVESDLHIDRGWELMEYFLRL